MLEDESKNDCDYKMSDKFFAMYDKSKYKDTGNDYQSHFGGKSPLNKDNEEYLNEDINCISNEFVETEISLNEIHKLSANEDNKLSLNKDAKITLNDDDKLSLNEEIESSDDDKLSSNEDFVINSNDDEKLCLNEDVEIDSNYDENLSLNEVIEAETKESEKIDLYLKNLNLVEDIVINDSDDLQTRRLKNIARNKRLLQEIFNEEFRENYGTEDAFQLENKKTIKNNNVNRRKHVKTENPIERRRSSRVRGEPVKYNEYELDKLFDDDKPKHKKTLYPVIQHGFKFLIHQKFPKLNAKRTPVPELDVSEVTQVHIDNISARAIEKVYSKLGSSCHQCRQKTVDTKTYCRSGVCSGVRGQFCGPCLQGRYGESVAEALRDPNWSCPPCRGICNCSICLTRQGFAPTGILKPVAVEKGYKSVKHYLEAFYTEIDVETPAKKFKKEKAKSILELLEDFSEEEIDVFLGFE